MVMSRTTLRHGSRRTSSGAALCNGSSDCSSRNNPKVSLLLRMLRLLLHLMDEVHLHQSPVRPPRRREACARQTTSGQLRSRLEESRRERVILKELLGKDRWRRRRRAVDRDRLTIPSLALQGHPSQCRNIHCCRC